MLNLYQPSHLLSKEDFNKIGAAFEKSWGRDTTFPDLKHTWNDQNKALGQCALTSLIIFDLFGGKIIYNKENFHLWNELPDGTQQDFSRNQFKEERVFTIYKYKSKDEVLYDEVGKETQIEDRYLLLKERFLIHLKQNT